MVSMVLYEAQKVMDYLMSPSQCKELITTLLLQLVETSGGFWFQEITQLQPRHMGKYFR
jgi:hypothetical protein